MGHLCLQLPGPPSPDYDSGAWLRLAVTTSESTELAVLLGEISYSVYLLHQIVFRSMRAWPPESNPIVRLAICVGVDFDPILRVMESRRTSVQQRG